MSTSVTMPALGESVSEGTVTRWLKQEGDQVNADEPLLEVSTDKVDTEIPSPASGVLTKIVVGEDETVAVGAELAVIGGDGDGGGSDGGQQEEQQQDAAPQQEEQQEAPAQEQQQEQQAEPQQEQQQQAAPQEQQEQPAEQPAQQSGGDSGGGEGGGGGTSVTMPALGESVSEGTVTRWLKQEGDQVNADEPLLEVSTDKVDTEIPSPASGVLTKIVVGEDETVAVGAELAVIGGGSGGGQQQEQPQQEQEQPAAAAGAGSPPSSRRSPRRRSRPRRHP